MTKYYKLHRPKSIFPAGIDAEMFTFAPVVLLEGNDGDVFVHFISANDGEKQEISQEQIDHIPPKAKKITTKEFRSLTTPLD